MASYDIFKKMNINHKIIQLYRNPIDNIFSWYTRGWGKRFITSIVCMLLGLLIIYFFGILQLTLIKGFEYAILKGFYPFLIGDLYKLLIAGILVPYIWKLAK